MKFGTVFFHKDKLKTYYYLGGIIFLCLYYLPFLIFGEDGYLIIHDNLDSTISWFTVIKQMYAPYYQNGAFIQIMNGLPDNMLMVSRWNITGLLFTILHPFVAYLLNDFLSRVIGFLGMVLLLDKIVSKDFKYRNFIIFSTAIIFALLGCYTTPHGLIVLGQPLVLFAFWNLYKDKVKWWYYLLILVFAFWSSLVISGIFICIFLALIWLWGIIKDKRFRLLFFTGIVLLAVGYLIEEHSLVFSLFDKSAITPHRVEFQLETFSILSQLNSVIRNGGLITSYHTGQFWTIFILLPLTYLIFSRKMTGFIWYLMGGIACVLVIVFIQPYIISWLGDKIAFIKTFNWGRFIYLLPMFWLILFAVSVEKLLESVLRLRLFFSIILVIGLFFSVTSHNRELYWNMGHLIGIKPQIPSFHDFYDTELFARIKKHIGKSDETYRVISLGLYPSIASYNGFFCLDSYQNLYPLTYKHSFCEVIANELDKNEESRDYFDGWGSRCYLFSVELGTNNLWSKEDNKKVFHLDINTEKLKQLSQKETYIISAVEIVNCKALELVLEEVFEGKYWKIYLYRV